MDFLEKDLEDILYYSRQQDVTARGLLPFRYDRIYRQMSLGEYGTADLITILRSGREIAVTVYELKNRVVSAATYWQTLRYMRGIEHFSNLLGISRNRLHIQGYMIGREVDKNGEVGYLEASYSNVQTYTYSYELDGIKFRFFDGYYRTNPGQVNLKKLGYNSPKDFLYSLYGIENSFESL